MGDSAGGNLATVVCQLLRDSGGPAIAHQALMYPATDLRTPADFDAGQPAAPDWPILSSAIMVTFRDHYLGPDGDAERPMASPILAEDLSGLPPALIQVAEYDPLRDDGIRYARALQARRHTGPADRVRRDAARLLQLPEVIRGSVRQALAELCAEQRYAPARGFPPLTSTGGCRSPGVARSRHAPSRRPGPGGLPPGARPRGRPASAVPAAQRRAAPDVRDRAAQDMSIRIW